MSKKQMAECSYEEQVAAYLSGWGFLTPAEVVADYPAYVSRAKEWGMTAIQCARNIEKKVRQ